MYGILSQLAKKMGRPAMKRVLNIMKQYPEARPTQIIKNEGAPARWYKGGGKEGSGGFSDESRLGQAMHMAEGADRYLNPHPGTFMNYVRGKVDNDPQRFKKVSDFFRANPDKRKSMDDKGGESSCVVEEGQPDMCAKITDRTEKLKTFRRI